MAKYDLLYEKYRNDENLQRRIKEGAKKEELKSLMPDCGSYFYKLMKAFGRKKYVFASYERKININPIEWDEFTSYFYGYMLGDGSLEKPCSVDEFGNSYGRIAVCSCDFQIIEDFSRILSGSKMKIYAYKPKGENCNVSYAVKASDRIWYNWFISKGFCVAKSKIQINIHYPDELNFRHFVRGLFDADGCFSDDEKLMWFQIYGQESYIEEIHRRLPFENKFSKSGKLYRISVSDSNLIERIYNYIYADSSICLNRKKIKIENFLKLKYGNINCS